MDDRTSPFVAAVGLTPVIGSLGELLRRHAHLKLGITSFAIVSFWPQTDFAVVSANVGFQSKSGREQGATRLSATDPGRAFLPAGRHRADNRDWLGVSHEGGAFPR
jgi:hypothetical protein